jgi:S1-C subfamily serine protease
MLSKNSFLFTVSIMLLAAVLTGCSSESKIFSSEEKPIELHKVITKIIYDSDEGTFLGSGVIFSSDGLVLTNNHVISDENFGTSLGKIKLCIAEKVSEEPKCDYDGEMIVRSEELDLAILKIKSEKKFDYVDIRKSPFKKSEDIILGDSVVAVGYPGVGGSLITLTKGVISGLDTKQNIKTDTTINQGNSGGGAFTNDNYFVGIPSFYVANDANKLSYLIPAYRVTKWIGDFEKQPITRYTSEEINKENINYDATNLDHEPADKSIISKFAAIEMQFKQNNYTPILEELDYIQKKRPQSALVYEYYGNYYMNTGDYKVALNYYKVAIALNPMKISAIGNYGVCLMNLNRVEDAMSAFEQVLAINPENLTAIYNLQTGYRSLGRGGDFIANKVATVSDDYSFPNYPIQYNVNKYDKNVEKVQSRLNDLGHDLAVDGYFGKKTLEAMKDFQNKNGLKVDGIVGIKTWTVLFSEQNRIVNTAAEELVANFYQALTLGDGVAAVQYVTPSKQGKGNYTVDGMTRFFGGLLTPLALEAVKEKNDDIVFVKYSYQKQGGDFCSDTADVYTKYEGDRLFIQKIIPQKGC